MNQDLRLITGTDIPFVPAQVTIHQPTIKEIAYIGEETFFSGVELLKISQNFLAEQDKSRLGIKTDFDVIMSVMKDKNPANRRNSACAKMVLTLLFPDYMIQVRKDYIALLKQIETEDGEKKFEEHALNNKCYPEFRKLIIQMFTSAEQMKEEYNPGGPRAAALAAKFKQAKQKIAEGGGGEGGSVFNRYISILAVGEQKDMNDLSNLTVYQLFDEFQRYQLKVEYDTTFQAKLAGAKDLKEVENWMKDIHEQ